MRNAGEWGLVQTVAPAAEPITIDQARSWLRVDSTDEDATITMLLKAARRFVERRTNRALIASTWRLTLDHFPSPFTACDGLSYQQLLGRITLPRGPVTAVTAVSYVDTAGTTQTLTAGTDYLVDLTREPVRIAPAYGKAWPTARTQQAAVSVDFVAGYTNAAEVPEDLTLAIRLLVGHWFEHRESVVVGVVSAPLQMAFDELVQPWRLWSFT